MTTFLIFIAGLFVGTIVGVFLMSILTMGKIADLETMIAVLRAK